MRDTLTAALQAATKARDARRISTLRLVSAAIKDRDIAARSAGKDQASDAELLELLSKMIKQRKESQKIYAEAGRTELAEQEDEEVSIIREFLPKQLSDADMVEAIDKAIAEVGAESVRDMGKVMGALKSQYAGQMDFGFLRWCRSDLFLLLCFHYAAFCEKAGGASGVSWDVQEKTRSCKTRTSKTSERNRANIWTREKGARTTAAG